MIKGLLTYLLT